MRLIKIKNKVKLEILSQLSSSYVINDFYVHIIFIIQKLNLALSFLIVSHQEIFTWYVEFQLEPLGNKMLVGLVIHVLYNYKYIAVPETVEPSDNEVLISILKG